MVEPIFDVSGAVAVLNQTLEYAYPTITVVGELSQFQVSKGKWLYFDIKDDDSKLKCFGTLFQLRTPLEDGMMIEVVAQPRLHNLYGFSLNVKSVRPVGEGSIKKSSDILRAKLDAEGLFAPERKRSIPYAPERIGLIASDESAAYADFIKIMNARWRGVEVLLYNVQVQGEKAPTEIVSAVQYFNQQAEPVDVLVMIRGGGSADDLGAFSTEPVVRAVSASRISTVVAIGHETDVSLAELAADLAASTPSNAAELLFPDKEEVKKRLTMLKKELMQQVITRLDAQGAGLVVARNEMTQLLQRVVTKYETKLEYASALLKSAHPQTNLNRGFALLTKNGKLISSTASVENGSMVTVTLRDGAIDANVERVY